jgi:hypothetical protein
MAHCFRSPVVVDGETPLAAIQRVCVRNYIAQLLCRHPVRNLALGMRIVKDQTPAIRPRRGHAELQAARSGYRLTAPSERANGLHCRRPRLGSPLAPAHPLSR